MPQQPSPETYGPTPSATPWARVLTAYMWSKTPPWSTPKVAAVLGVNRSRVSNWVYKGIIPELDTMLVVMAKLNIPLVALIHAYAEEGLPMPPLTIEEAKARQATLFPPEQLAPPATPRPAPAPRAIASTPVPHGRIGLHPRTPSQPARAASYDEETPDTTPPSSSDSDGESWEKMVAHTRKVMAMAGMTDDALNTMLAEIADARPKHAGNTGNAGGAPPEPSADPSAEPSAERPAPRSR